MDFFEKLGKKASETFNTTAEKANKIATDTKLKLKINDLKTKINDAYQDIGKVVYQKYVLDGNLDIKEDIEEQLNKISEMTDEIEKYEGQRLELDDKKQCVECKNKIERNAKFCPECGAKQPEEPVYEPEVAEETESEETNVTEDVKEEVSQDVEETVEEDNNQEQ